MEKLTTDVTEEDIKNVVKDEFGVVYSKDCKMLLKGNLELKTYIIKDGTQIIYNHAFDGCHSLQQITIPYSITSIGDCAFFCCSSLQQITLPNSIKSIGALAFWGCSSLRHITIPNSVTSIGKNPFVNCPLLTLKSLSFRFIVEKGLLIDRQEQNIITYIGGIDTILNSVRSIGDLYLVEFNPLQNIIIPNSITRIGDFAFWGCSSLQQITIPNSVTNIGDSAFSSCSSLQQITIPNSVTCIGVSAFSCCSSLQQITIPNSITSIGKNPFVNCPLLTLESQSFRFIVDNGLLIDSQEQILISYVGNNKEITILNSITSIGDRAFSYCKSLQHITIPNSVMRIGNDAFDGCNSLQQIIVPEKSVDQFKKLLPKELWDKLFYLKKAINQPNEDKSGTNGCNYEQ